MSTNNSKKIQTNDNKETKTFTESLSDIEITDLLDGYNETPYNELQVGFNVRYYSKNKMTNKMDFKIGGVITHINLPTHIVLNNRGCKNWNVKIDGAIFYQQIPIHILKINMEKKYPFHLSAKICEHKSTIHNIKSTIKNLQNEIIKLKSKKKNN